MGMSKFGLFCWLAIFLTTSYLMAAASSGSDIEAWFVAMSMLTGVAAGVTLVAIGVGFATRSDEMANEIEQMNETIKEGRRFSAEQAAELKAMHKTHRQCR